MKETKLQVAAAEPGMVYDIAHEKTPWQQYSDSFHPLGRARVIFRSRAQKLDDDGKPVTSKKGSLVFQSNTYVRPRKAGEIKGKRNLRFAKRERVRAMKAAQAEKV